MLCSIEFGQKSLQYSMHRGVAKVLGLMEVYTSQLLRNLKTKLL